MCLEVLRVCCQPSNFLHGRTVSARSAHSRQSLGDFFRAVKASISSAIKPSLNRLDLGNVGIDVLCTPGGDYYHDIAVKGMSSRVPPLLPEAVEEKFRNKEVVFTKKGDIGVVSKLYRKFFQDVSSAAETLERRT